MENGLTLRGSSQIGGGSKLTFNGSQMLKGIFTIGDFKGSGATFALTPGTALTLAGNNFFTVQDETMFQLGNKDATNKTSLIFRDHNEFKGEKGGARMTATIEANSFINEGELEINYALLRKSLLTATFVSTRFVNKSQADLVGTVNFDTETFVNDGTLVASDNKFELRDRNDANVTITTTSFTNNRTVMVGNPHQDIDRLTVQGTGGAGAAINNGDITVYPSSTASFLTGYTQNKGSTKVNGTIIIQQNGEKAKGVEKSGLVEGTGIIKGDWKVEGGDFKPGNTPGILTIQGAFDMAGGVFDEEIGRRKDGPMACDESGCYSQLDVTGGVRLGGSLHVQLDSAPDIGDLYGIIDNLSKRPVLPTTFADLPQGGVFGTDFDGIDYLFQISYQGNIESPSLIAFDGGNDVVLKVIGESPISAPEPSSLIDLLSGVVLLHWLIRSRHSNRGKTGTADM